MSVIEKVQHYQRSIEKCFDNEERVMYCISKLYQLPVTVQHLRETGVGRTVNSLRKFDGGVGNAAKALVCKWKTMVADEDSSDPEEEDEACVPDAPESYSESPESPSPDNTSENNRPRHNNEESKEKSVNKSTKHGSSEHSSKYSLKSNTNSEVSKSNKSSDKERHSKTESKNHEQKQENRKHSSKHEYDNEKSRTSKEQDTKRRHDSKDKNRTDSDIGKVSSSTESCEMNDNHRKRKQEKSTRDKEVNKKRRYSDSESEEDNSRLIINSPIVSEPESPNAESDTGTETSGTSKKKSNHSSCDKTPSRKETSDKEKKRNKEKSDTKHKSKSEGERESSKPKDSKKDDKRKKESHSSSKHSSKSKSSHSSSSSKERSRSSDVEQEKDKKHKRDDKSKSSDSKENDKDQKLKKKIKKENSEEIDGIDSQSGTSFAEALGMCTMPPPSRKRGNYPSSSSAPKPIKVEPGTSCTSAKISPPITIKTEASNINLNPLSLLSSNVKLEPLSIDLASTLPEISPNYKPLAHSVVPVNRKIDECRALSDAIYCKTQRTKVFSGNKSSLTNIPTLYELCIRVLIDNIEALEVTGGVPYYIIKPVLERATPDQLFMLEHFNPYLIEDTDPLWKFHCSREFRTQSREEMESWRDMYMRCLDEREAKLKAFTANMKHAMDKSVPVRSTIQVYDDHIKPPRNVLRKQAKYGTARDLPITSSEVKKKLISGNTQSNSSTTCPPSPIARIKASSSTIGKKTKAPLMAKAIKFIKGSYRR
ncbi:transcription elongation factor B polypeptide 3 [Leptopilina heterotoma]|uniref:transcription elongation factor B polypeptide 3 n=1 Tax=Leptopilina heterotoma TaxID=63436 RepID=UPI001CA83ECB|nr:transcription elongation factor B polypeptide 3 [Leptopilina heterotoma]